MSVSVCICLGMGVRSYREFVGVGGKPIESECVYVSRNGWEGLQGICRSLSSVCVRGCVRRQKFQL